MEAPAEAAAGTLEAPAEAPAGILEAEMETPASAGKAQKESQPPAESRRLPDAALLRAAYAEKVAEAGYDIARESRRMQRYYLHAVRRSSL